MKILDWLFGDGLTRYENKIKKRRYKTEHSQPSIDILTPNYFDDLESAKKFFWDMVEHLSRKEMRKSEPFFGKSWQVILIDQTTNKIILHKCGTYGKKYQGYK